MPIRIIFWERVIKSRGKSIFSLFTMIIKLILIGRNIETEVEVSLEWVNDMGLFCRTKTQHTLGSVSPFRRGGKKGIAEPRMQTGSRAQNRSEEHTSELQSRGHLVCRLL